MRKNVAGRFRLIFIDIVSLILHIALQIQYEVKRNIVTESKMLVLNECLKKVWTNLKSNCRYLVGKAKRNTKQTVCEEISFRVFGTSPFCFSSYNAWINAISLKIYRKPHISTNPMPICIYLYIKCYYYLLLSISRYQMVSGFRTFLYSLGITFVVCVCVCVFSIPFCFIIAHITDSNREEQKRNSRLPQT